MARYFKWVLCLWGPGSFTLRYASTKLFFGPNSVNRLAKFLEKHGLVAVVTGRSSARVSGALDDVLGILKGVGTEYFVVSGVPPNPWVSSADEVAERLWREGADAVIAVGGGSVIDTAKVAAVIVASGGRAADYVTFRKRVKASLPLYAINLTHGTGSEVDRYAVLTTDETREKRGASITYPVAGVDDPRYTVTLPQDHTIYTALDALYHAYEASTSKDLASPYVTLISKDAVTRIREWLHVAVAEPRNLDARGWLLYASMLAGIAIDASSTHVIHGVEHALSGINPKLPHGAGLAIVGPKLIKHTHKASPRNSAEVLKALDPKLRPTPDDAEKAAEAVREFQEAVGFNRKLSDYGFGRDDVKEALNLIFGPLKYLWDKVTPFKLSKELIREVLEESL